MMTAAHLLKALLRINAVVCWIALIPAVMPTNWMDVIHRRLGLGPLPPGPVFEYLARSISLLYAGVGTIAWLLSRDLVKYRSLIVCYALGYVIFGAMLIWIDRRAGLPTWWAIQEGPFVMLVGCVTLIAAACCSAGAANRDRAAATSNQQP